MRENQNINDMCFVCGYDNPLGLHGQFVEDSEKPGEVIAYFEGHNQHTSYPGRIHGGVLAAMCDETIGRAFITNHPDQWGVTMKLDIRYHRPTPTDQPLEVRGRITKVTGRTFEGECEILDQGGTKCVSAKAVYYRMDVDTILEQCGEDNGYVFIPDNRPLPETDGSWAESGS